MLPPGQTRIPPSQTEQKNSKLIFNLDESPISEQWKEQIQKKLQSISKVFALDDVIWPHYSHET